MAVAAGALRFNSDSQKMEWFDGNQWVEVVASSPDLQTGGTRGLFFGGYAPTAPQTTSSINYVTISTTGNATSFGNLSYAGQDWIGCSSSTRGIMAGSNPTGNAISYVTISSTGDAQSFGTLTQVSTNRRGSCSNSTRNNFLKHNTCETLYLVGDIIDAWKIRQNKWRWKQSHTNVVRRILGHSKRGTRVIYVAGNHDEFLRPFMQYGLGFGKIGRAHV